MTFERPRPAARPAPARPAAEGAAAPGTTEHAAALSGTARRAAALPRTGLRGTGLPGTGLRGAALPRTGLRGAVLTAVLTGTLAGALTGCAGDSAAALRARAGSGITSDPSAPAPTGSSDPGSGPPSTGAATPDASSSASRKPAAFRQAAATCSTGSLTLALGSADAGGSHERDVLTLTNTGADRCQLDGYPTVEVSDTYGTMLPLTVAHDGDFTFPSVAAKPVTLAAHGVASFDFGFRRVPAGDQASPCPVGTILLVTPPGTTGTLSLAMPVSACDARVAVSPVVSGSIGVSR